MLLAVKASLTFLYLYPYSLYMVEFLPSLGIINNDGASECLAKINVISFLLPRQHGQTGQLRNEIKQKLGVQVRIKTRNLLKNGKYK